MCSSRLSGLVLLAACTLATNAHADGYTGRTLRTRSDLRLGVEGALVSATAKEAPSPPGTTSGGASTGLYVGGRLHLAYHPFNWLRVFGEGTAGAGVLVTAQLADYDEGGGGRLFAGEAGFAVLPTVVAADANVEVSRYPVGFNTMRVAAAAVPDASFWLFGPRVGGAYLDWTAGSGASESTLTRPRVFAGLQLSNMRDVEIELVEEGIRSVDDWFDAYVDILISTGGAYDVAPGYTASETKSVGYRGGIQWVSSALFGSPLGLVSMSASVERVPGSLGGTLASVGIGWSGVAVHH